MGTGRTRFGGRSGVQTLIRWLASSAALLLRERQGCRSPLAASNAKVPVPAPVTFGQGVPWRAKRSRVCPALSAAWGDRPAALVPRAQIARPWGVLQKFTSFNHCDEKARGTIQYRPSREGTVPCRTSKCSPQNHAIALIDYQLRCTRARNRTIGVHIIGSFEPPGGTVEARTSAMIRQ